MGEGMEGRAREYRAHFFFGKCAKSHVRQCRRYKKMFACGELSSSPELSPILKILATPLFSIDGIDKT